MRRAALIAAVLVLFVAVQVVALRVGDLPAQHGLAGLEEVTRG